MQEKEMTTTVAHSRKGSTLHIKGVTGNVKIVGQQRAVSRDTVNIEVACTAEAHDSLQIHGAKGTVQIINREIVTPPRTT